MRIELETMLEIARDVLTIESRALECAAERLDAQFEQAVQLILNSKGRVVVTGMGKSGHIGSKIAATLASTGTASFFVHPGEASHGDLGMIQRDDCVLALSNSGETQEMLAILPLLKRYDIQLISMTGNARSTMARLSDAHIDAGVDKEACPLNLAPTASTTTALALGDALAVCLLRARGFSRDDFARSHPGGALGRRLLLRVGDVMQRDPLPLVAPHLPLSEALVAMTQGGFGVAVVVDAAQQLLGVFTDGDLRRCLDRGLVFQDSTVEAAMTHNPAYIEAEQLAAEALNLMDQRRIGALVVLQQHKVIGILGMHDLLRAGIG